MKRLVTLLVILIVGLAGLGFYLGWFQLSSTAEGERSNYTISVDKSKIQADKDKAIGRLQELGEDVKSRPAADAPPPPPETEPPLEPEPGVEPDPEHP
jgi:hypothetical protein